MQLINPAMVGVTRTLIQSQGGNPFLINDHGELNPDGVLALLFDTVEVQTSITPSIRFPIGPTGQPPSPAAEELIKSLQPSIVFSGPAGRIVVAPYGQATTQASWWPVVIAGGATLVLLSWLVFGGRR